MIKQFQLALPDSRPRLDGAEVAVAARFYQRKVFGGRVCGLWIGGQRMYDVTIYDAADADLSETLARFRDVRPPGESVDGALLFSCSGRGANLFTSADHDVLAVRAGLATTGVAGFFAAGEIGPVVGRTRLHGNTASVLAFS